MIRIGVDFGGTKIEAAALDAEGRFLARVRAPNPGGYDESLAVVRDLVAQVEGQTGQAGSVGVGTPGSISPRTGLIRNANSTWLNGRAFRQDLERTLGRPIRMANDANCLAVSEAVDGAAAGAHVVFAAILGTGCGGGIAVDGRPIEGRNGIAGEWGHTPLPGDREGRACWCGRLDCLETYIAGPALDRDPGGLDRYIERLGRSLAVIVNVLDPDVIVLGGGVSNVAELYDRLPAAIAAHVFSDVFDTPVLRAKHGDSSGVRGAAWLWPLE